jgi:uncharacterized phage protein gp47/JayE
VISLPSTGEIVAKMRDALRIAEPNLDTSVGTVARNILDTVGEAIGEAYSDNHLLNYAYDIDSKIEGDLDDFVALFGFSRIPAQRAQGAVTFTRPNDDSAASTSLVIAPGTQVVAQTNPIVYVQTTVSAVMAPGAFSVTVPVQAVSAGARGNVAAGLLTTLVSSSTGITSVTNTAPLSGGTAEESDSELRERFKRTVFRSLAGTEQMYLGVALEVPQDALQPDTRLNSRVTILGSTKRYREQIQVTSGTATTSVANAAYIYPDNVYCGPDIDNGQFLVQGSEFTFTPTNPTDNSNASGTLASVNSVAMPDGLYDLEYEYVSQASRNDPANTRFNSGNVNNRVDIWVDGSIVESAVQAVVFSTANVFSASSSSILYNNRHTQSNPAQANPTVGWYYVPLSFGPILSVPATITIGATTYSYGSDYWFVLGNDAFGFMPNSRYGLAWTSAVGRQPPNGTSFSLTYTYNRAAYDSQEALRNWRLLGTDSRVHAGVPSYVKFNLAVIYDRRFDPTAVKTEIDTSLADFINGISFGGVVQVSDVLNVVHNVPGVDNVRFLTSTDHATVYAISRMSRFDTSIQVTVVQSGGRAIDFYLGDQFYPVFHSTNIVTKAPNNFGVA